MPVTPEGARRHLADLAKPPGSLGRLEAVAGRLCAVQNTLAPVTRPRRCVIFAADHGVVAAGVSAWPQAVTAAMVATIRAGRAVSSAFARTFDADLRVVDVGTAGPESPAGPGFRSARVCAGSANLADGPALTTAEFRAAWAVGVGEADRCHADGMALVIAGEVGIGNTTAASVLTALLLDVVPEHVVGRGAGADVPTLLRKMDVVAQKLAAESHHLAGDPEATIASCCGAEIAAMAGFLARSAALGLTVVLDGFVATAALLVADRLCPGVADRVIAGHRSAEPGHAAALAHLGLEPVLDGWQLCLGEGTGALLALPLLDAAAAVCSGVATLAEVGAARAE